MTAQPQPLSSAREFEQEMKHLSGRDTQLWLIGFLVLLVMASGVIALVLPNILELGTLHAEGRYLPQLFLGLIAIIVLFNTYLLEQRRALNIARQELVRQMLINEKNEQATLIDPLTDLFNRRYLEQIMPREISRATRQSCPLTLLLVDLDQFKEVNDRYGHVAGDEVLVETARLLQRTLRGSDTVVRYGGDEFLVIMPDTDEKQAQYAIERLQNEVGVWNADATRDCQLSLSCGAAEYVTGDDANALIGRADTRMYADKARHREGAKAQAAVAG